jgi:glycosyltransferase involved in cell wall biosynthesis
MRILYVVQRYGEQVAGGSEQHTRMFAERLVPRGHRVEVLTTCASSYVDWANTFPPGTSNLNGVWVHRVEVARQRDYDGFGDVNARMVLSRTRRPLALQRHWMWLQGPYAPQMLEWLRVRARDYDAVVFVTYLYWTAWAGVQACAGAAPTVLHPTAHDEPMIQLSIFDESMYLPDVLAFLTPEEASSVRNRFPRAPEGDVIGIGVDVDVPCDPTRFRAAFGIDDAPYLLCVGRVDISKGARELAEYFAMYKERNPSDLRLVFLGEPVYEVPARPDVIVTGFVDDDLLGSALSGSVALVQPSYFESFSMALVESFARARPALVQSRCDVLAGHAARSQAAIPYAGFAEFEAAVKRLVTDPTLANRLGERGRAYVEREYAWDVVLDRYERLLARAAVRLASPLP